MQHEPSINVDPLRKSKFKVCSQMLVISVALFVCACAVHIFRGTFSLTKILMAD